MPKVEDVKLNVQRDQPDMNEGFPSDHCRVTVRAILRFEPKDEGSTFFYDIWLRGEDKAGSETMHDFTFTGFGGGDRRRITVGKSKFGLLLKRPIIAAEILPLEVLDEDPGTDPPHPDAELPLPMPRGDEIFAQVRLYEEGIFGVIVPVASGRSATQKF